MKEQNVKITTSLEARQIALFVQTTNKFNSTILMKIDNKTVNAKSVMGMISLAVMEGQEFTVSCDGVDESEALESVIDFLSNVYNM